MAAINTRIATFVVQHFTFHMCEEIAHVITYFDSPVKAAAVAVAALHMHRNMH